MNNKQQKNIIYGQNSIESLPYTESNLGKDELVKNSTNINNAFQQLLDNDLYIENELNKVGNKIVGPKGDDSEETLRNSPDGYKCWGDVQYGSELSILHKIESEPQDSIARVDNTPVKFIFGHGNAVFVSSDRLRYTEDGNTYTTVGDIIANGYYNSEQVVMFAANDGIYVLVTEIRGFGIPTYGIVKINKNDIGVVTAVEFDEKNNRVIAGTQTGVYIGEIFAGKSFSELENGITFYQKMMVSTKVNDIQIVDSGSGQILATDNGMFKSSNRVGFRNLTTFRSVTGKNCKCSATLGDTVYFGLSDGLYKLTQDEPLRVFETGQIFSFSSNDYQLYFNTEHSIYRVDIRGVVTKFADVDETIVKVQQATIGGNRGVFYLSSTGKLRFISDNDTGLVASISAIDGTVQDFVVKTGSRNRLFAQTSKKVVALEINEIYQHESDIPDTTNEYRGNDFINDHFPTEENPFLGLMEDNDKLFVVASRYIVDVDNPDLHHEILDEDGHIVAYQTIKDGNDKKYLVVCEKCAFILNSSLARVWKTNAESEVAFIGGYCGSNFMILFTKDETKNRIVTYSFPTNITETGVLEIPAGSHVADICEDDSSVFFTLDTDLFCARKNNVLRCVKEDDSTLSFDIVDVESQTGTSPAVMTLANNHIGIEIITDTAVETDEDGDKTYHLSSETLSVAQEGTVFNGMLYLNNSVYALTDRGVLETPIAQHNDSFTLLESASYLSDKTIVGGTIFGSRDNGRIRTTKLFVDNAGGVYGRYGASSTQPVVNITDTIAAVLSDNNEGESIFAYASPNSLIIKMGNSSKSYSVGGVKKMRMTDENILIQNTSGVSAITQDLAITKVSNLAGFGVGMFYNLDDATVNGMRDIIVASETQLKRYRYADEKVSIELIHDFSTDGKRIVSISKVSDNNFVVNHGSGYSVCSIDSSGSMSFTSHTYPNGITDVAFFCNHGIYNIIKQTTGGYSLSSYSDEGGSDIKDIGVINGYCDTEGDIVYSTSAHVKNGYGDILYSGSGITGVVAVDDSTGPIVWLQDSVGLKQIVDEWKTTSIPTSRKILKLWNSDDILFYLIGNDLHYGNVESLTDILNGNIFDESSDGVLLSDPNIRDIVFSDTENGTHIYVLTDTTLHIWEYSDDVENSVDKKNNYHRINIGSVNGFVKKFVDGGVFVSKDGDNLDITSAVFGIPQTDDLFDNHGIFLCRNDGSETTVKSGFYQLDESTQGISRVDKIKNSVTALANLNGDIIFGSSADGSGGIYGLIADGSDYSTRIYDFGGGTTYGSKVMSMLVSDGIPYVKNTSSWRVLSNGRFAIVDAFMDGSRIKSEFSTILGISRFGEDDILVTNGNIYTLSHRTQYNVEFGNEHVNSFSGDIMRLVDDVGSVRVLVADDSNLLSEYKSQIDTDGILFQKTNTPASKNIVYVNNSASSGQKFTQDPDGYHVIYADTNIQDCPDFDIESTQTITKLDDLYVVGTDKEMYSFYGIADDVSYSRIETVPDIVFHKIVSISDTQYLMNSETGLYSYYTQTGICFKNSIDQTDDILALATYRLSDYEPWGYIYGDKNGSVYTSTNYKKWTFFVRIPDAEVTDVFVRNSKEYYIGTNNGLYKTNYSYKLINDIPKYTIENASELYNSMFDTLSAMVHDAIEEHIRENHSTSSFIGYVNDEILSTNFEPVVDFYKETKLCSGTELCSLQSTNELVGEMYTSDIGDGDIMLSVSNFLSSYQAENFSYIMKRYTSGVTELFIYVPTTNTYYLPHVDGSSYCVVDKDIEIKRRNLGSFELDKQSVKSKTDGNYTDIVVSITSSLYHIDNIMDIEINGNSLPLKIYKDGEYEESDRDAVFMFHSKIYPSIVRKYDISKTDEEGYYNFRFSCFGSDAQAIRIQFYDSQNHKDTDTYKVRFELNGGVGTMTDQRFNVGQNKSLKKAEGRITNGNKMFTGWSLKQKPTDNSTPDYIDRDMFPGDIDISQYVRDGIVRLYAVWLNYMFTEEDTTFVVDADTEEFYINSGDINVDPRIGRKAVIDYGN